MNEEENLEKLNANSLIEDIPYHKDFKKIKNDSYLSEFKTAIENLLDQPIERVIQFSRFGAQAGNISDFEENEGIKFLIVQDKNALYFLSISNNTVIKNKSIFSLSVTENTTVVDVPRGIQIPPAVTSRLDRKFRRLFVYDVNRCEVMLTVNENRKVKMRERQSRNLILDIIQFLPKDINL